MLMGNLNCTEINTYLLKYIDFKLSKNRMEQVAIHLRNCPVCMEKYTKIQKRRKILKMQNDISSYIDMETTERENFYLEGKFLSSKRYKNELKHYEKISELLQKSRRQVKEITKNNITETIIKKIEEHSKKSKGKIIEIFQQLLRVLPKFE